MTGADARDSADTRSGGHVVLTSPHLHGFQYGVLHDLVHEIVRVTGAREVPVPVRRLPRALAGRLVHGTRYAGLRGALPRPAIELPPSDVLWMPLIGAEDATLDLFRGWDRTARVTVLYVIDAFEASVPALRRLLAAGRWDVAITAYEGALPMLERATGRRWHAVPLGVRLDRFAPVAPERRVIDFSAYGRRDPAAHASLRAWAEATGGTYDYSIEGSAAADATPDETYRRYAWHVRHSAYTLGFPIEYTHPGRVRSFSPVSTRWFEAAAAATVAVGVPPSDPEFARLLGDDACVRADPRELGAAGLAALWARLANERADRLAAALARRDRLVGGWTWESRVRQVQELVAAL